MAKTLSLLLFTLILGTSLSKGFFIVIFSIFLAFLLLRKEKYDKVGLKIGPSLFMYLALLIKEIYLSTFAICKTILFKKRSKLMPIITEINTAQITDEARVLLGNSITLTPGTITMDVLKNKIIIHAISRECAAGCSSLDSAIIRSQK